ncbi:unnamed protein product, partial [marine sediment metagenome]
PRTFISCLIATLLAIYVNVSYVPYSQLAYIIITGIFNLVTIIILKIYTASNNGNNSTGPIGQSGSVRGIGITKLSSKRLKQQRIIIPKSSSSSIYMLYLLFITSHLFTSLLIEYLYKPDTNEFIYVYYKSQDLYEILNILQYLYVSFHFIIALICKLFYPSFLGNTSVLITFLYSLYIAVKDGYSDTCVFILSPLLLLLSSYSNTTNNTVQQSKLSKSILSFEYTQRYYPVYLSIFLYISYRIIKIIIIQPLFIKLGYELPLHIDLNQYNLVYMLQSNSKGYIFEWTLLQCIKELILYIANIPINIYIINYLGKTSKKIQLSKLFILIPLAILGILFTDIYCAQLLYIASFIISIIINKKGKRQQERGKKIL